MPECKFKVDIKVAHYGGLEGLIPYGNTTDKNLRSEG